MLKDQIVIVIGGSSGIGLEVARQVMARGGRPVVIGRSPDKVKRAVGGLGLPATGHASNIADRRALQAIFERIGRFNHLVTTAAELVFKPFTEVAPEELGRAVDSKVVGPFYAAQCAAARISREGSITFFSGVAAYKPAPTTAVAALANAALEGLAKALAVELAPVRVNVISPGIVDTPLWTLLPPAERQAFYESTARALPARRIGQVGDLAHAALFAMGNRFLTGTVLHVDGGGRLS